jgi:hypothetical protein
MDIGIIIQTLKRTHLPTLLVEGTGDSVLFRNIDEAIGILGSVIVCGNREQLFEIFRRRSEFQTAKVAFLADRDLFVFSSPPKEYSEIIFTDGYSIENDMLSEDYDLKLMHTTEVNALGAKLEVIKRWFAREVDSALTGGIHEFKTSPSYILQQVDAGTLLLPLLNLSKRVHQQINREPRRFIRGKNILHLSLFFLNKSGRSATYSKAALLEIGCTCAQSKKFQKIIGKIKNKLK